VSQTQLALFKVLAPPPGGPVAVPYPNVLHKISEVFSKIDTLLSATGEHISKGELTASKLEAAGHKLEYLKLTMQDVIISSYSIGTAEKAGPLVESLFGTAAGVLQNLVQI